VGILGALRRLVHSFVEPSDLSEGDVLVFDTSSLSHGFEEFSHAAVSAYMEMKEPRTWGRLRARLLRRVESEHAARRLLLGCDRARCIVPLSVYRELESDPHYRDSLDVLTGYGWRVEEKYVRRKSRRGSPTGFSRVFKPRLLIRKPRRELTDYVLVTAERLGLRISRADAEGVALAIEENGVLVTADRRQAEVADKLGLRVIYTIGKPKKAIEAATAST